MPASDQSIDNANFKLAVLSVTRLSVVLLRSVNTNPPIFPVVSHGPFVPNGFTLRRSFPVLMSIFPCSTIKSIRLHYPRPFVAGRMDISSIGDGLWSSGI